MPILPLDHPEPFAATLGVMLYPAMDVTDPPKARAFAAQYLAEPIRRLHEAGGTMPYDVVVRLLIDAGQPLTDLEERWRGGRATGETFKTFFVLANTDPALASRNNAIKIAQLVAKKFKVRGARTNLWKAKSRFLTVAHLWGAWSIREGKFGARPEVGKNGYADFQSFLAEAEDLREWGQAWRAPRAKSKPLLPTEVWRVPENWTPPEPRPGWPEEIMLPNLKLPKDLLAKLRPSGRRRKRG